MRHPLSLLAATAALLGCLAAPAEADENWPTTDEFLSGCQTDWDLCVEDVTFIEFFSDAGEFGCVPASVSDNDLTIGVVSWLHNHPENRSGDYGDSVAAASKALWPCPQ